MSASARHRPIISITGATGTGKSQLAVQLALALRGEIINADALQLYRGLPVATNKILPEEMHGVAHHLLGCVELDEEPWTINKFVNRAQSIVDDIHSRGKVPIVVGGTHYYVQALLLENSIIETKTEPELSNQTHEQWPILEAPVEDMLQKLRDLDPEAADWWHPRDERKIRRSLEVCLKSGRRVSDIYQEQREAKDEEGPAQHERYNSLCFHLHADREPLVARLDKRVDQMIEKGLVAEIKFMHEEHARLQKHGNQSDNSKGIWVAIGYKEFANYLELLAFNKPGDMSGLGALEAQGAERTKISTRQYAVRQSKWIKNKFIPALDRARCLDRLFVLDATDLETWKQNVGDRAISVAASFLHSEELPEKLPFDTAMLAKLTPNKDKRVKNECDVCQVVTVTAQQWNQHIKSSKHRHLKQKSEMKSEYLVKPATPNMRIGE